MFQLLPGARKCIILAAGLLSFGTPAFCVGPFVDASRVSAFIRAPREPGLTGSITRADAQGEGASFFQLDGRIPLRTAFTIQPELCYITMSRGDEIEDGFGDVILRSKTRLWSGHRDILFLTADLRLGSGTADLFPYSTASTDFQAGLAFVDSVGIAGGGKGLEPLGSFSYWISAAGCYVIRNTKRLEDIGAHGSYASAGGGVIVGLTRRIEIEAGGLGLFFDASAPRELYFAKIAAALSPDADLSVTVQGERGDWQDRAVDASVGIALAVAY